MVINYNKDMESKNIREEIGGKINEIRRARNMTQEELASKCGITRTTISKIEHGKFSVSVDMLARICEELGAKVEITTR